MMRRTRIAWLAVLAPVLTGLATAASAPAVPAPVHGLWVWKSTAVLAVPRGAETLVAFCRSAGITEAYVSFPSHAEPPEERAFAELIARLHASGIRAEALLSSIDADEAGAPRGKLLEHVQAVLRFDREHPTQSFDGVHLDIEPQQRAENKGAGNLVFLPGLVQALRDVRKSTDGARLTLNADIQMKLLKGGLEQRRALMTAAPRLTLMLYELSRPDDGNSEAQKLAQLQESAAKFLAMAYEGLGTSGESGSVTPGAATAGAPTLARLAIALRTPDYGPLLPKMLEALDAANRGNPHYLGWARHSYNDVAP